MSAINRFIDRVRSAERGAERTVNLSLQEARDLHSELTRLLAKLEQHTENTTTTVSENIEIVVKGEDF